MAQSTSRYVDECLRSAEEQGLLMFSAVGSLRCALDRRIDWGEVNKMMGRMRSMANQMQGGGKKGKKGKRGKKMRMPGMPGMGGMDMNALMRGLGGNGAGGLGGLGGGSTDMDMLRQMEQQMRGKR